VLRVYLDQNKWVDLARTFIGDPRGDPFKVVYGFALEAVRLGIASFPLSTIHYIETSKTRNLKRRRDLAMAMLSLARPAKAVAPDTIAAMDFLLPCEIDQALKSHFGRPRSPRSYPVFGKGVGHAFSQEPIGFDPPADLPIDAVTREKLRQQGTAYIESGLLIGDPEFSMDEAVRRRLYEEIPSNYVARRKHFSELFQRERIGKAKRTDYLSAEALIGILDPLKEAMARASVPPDELFGQSKAYLQAFLREVPLGYVEYEMNKCLHDSANYKPKLNDLHDVAALSVALVYCDVVITERHWVHIIKQAGLDKVYGTVMLSNLNDLSTLLLTGSLLKSAEARSGT
jgi:hypothetical protein